MNNLFNSLSLANTILTMYALGFSITFIMHYMKSDKKKMRNEKIDFTHRAIVRVKDILAKFDDRMILKNEEYHNSEVPIMAPGIDYELSSIIDELRVISECVLNDIYDEEYVKISLQRDIYRVYSIQKKMSQFYNFGDLYSIEILMKKWGAM